MSKSELMLVRLLAEKMGIYTAGELEEFKRIADVKTNDMLIKRLALYVATDTTFEEVKEYKRVCNKA